MKDLFKDDIPIDGKKLSLEGVHEKIYKKWFVLARKSVFTTRNKAFVEKYFSAIWKNCFF